GRLGHRREPRPAAPHDQAAAVAERQRDGSRCRAASRIGDATRVLEVAGAQGSRDGVSREAAATVSLSAKRTPRTYAPAAVAGQLSWPRSIFVSERSPSAVCARGSRTDSGILRAAWLRSRWLYWVSCFTTCLSRAFGCFALPLAH